MSKKITESEIESLAEELARTVREGGNWSVALNGLENLEGIEAVCLYIEIAQRLDDSDHGMLERCCKARFRKSHF
ncbi:MAG: hypothetical protein WBB28_20770 [Crinalium sp.]